jgi:hypothetical protein
VLSVSDGIPRRDVAQSGYSGRVSYKYIDSIQAFAYDVMLTALVEGRHLLVGWPV